MIRIAPLLLLLSLLQSSCDIKEAHAQVQVLPPPPPLRIYEDGTRLDLAYKLNFVGSGATCTGPTNGIIACAFSATQSPTFGATMNIDCTTGGEHKRIALTANLGVWTMTAGFAGQICTISFIQDGTGSRTIGTVPANVVHAGGSLTLTTTINKRDNITYRYDATDSKWYEMSRSLNM